MSSLQLERSEEENKSGPRSLAEMVKEKRYKACPMKIEKLDHIHIAVEDLEKTAEFFSDLFETSFSETITDPDVEVKAKIDPLGLELLEPTNGAIGKFLESEGEGIQALSFKVADLEEAVEEAESKGIRKVGEMETGNVKEVQLHPKDTHGVMIELCEYKEEHDLATAIKKED